MFVIGCINDYPLTFRTAMTFNIVRMQGGHIQMKRIFFIQARERADLMLSLALDRISAIQIPRKHFGITKRTFHKGCSFLMYWYK